LSKETLDFVTHIPAEKLQNFFGVFLQFHIGVDSSPSVNFPAKPWSRNGLKGIRNDCRRRRRGRMATPPFRISTVTGRQDGIQPLPSARQSPGAMVGAVNAKFPRPIKPGKFFAALDAG
ncbi:MAG: hypothetical protein HFF80_10240, partial [Oscillospiraceae bacterium]|jgi:hypothetical protein|nr:hypothetical protein [Oscillospiraceae bacterium]